MVEVGDDEEGTVCFCRKCYAGLRLTGLIIRNPEADPEPVPADAGRVLHFAPDGSPLRGYYPGVECEHGYDACPTCDASDTATPDEAQLTDSRAPQTPEEKL